jgi:hypothetical protein
MWDSRDYQKENSEMTDHIRLLVKRQVNSVISQKIKKITKIKREKDGFHGSLTHHFLNTV